MKLNQRWSLKTCCFSLIPLSSAHGSLQLILKFLEKHLLYILRLLGILFFIHKLVIYNLWNFLNGFKLPTGNLPCSDQSICSVIMGGYCGFLDNGQTHTGQGWIFGETYLSPFSGKDIKQSPLMSFHLNADENNYLVLELFSIYEYDKLIIMHYALSSYSNK